ncbi:MAG: hypothetical protein R2834_04265 [Rhodothermales bacterium]
MGSSSPRTVGLDDLSAGLRISFSPGLLVIGSASLSNPWTAVALSSALATATISRRAKETFATVPYSLLLGFVALGIEVGVGRLPEPHLPGDRQRLQAVLFNPEMRFVREAPKPRQRAHAVTAS